MPSRNKVKGFWKSPGGIALAVIALVAMILAIVVFFFSKTPPRDNLYKRFLKSRTKRERISKTGGYQDAPYGSRQ